MSHRGGLHGRRWDALELWLDDQGLDASDLASTELWAVPWGSNATGFLDCLEEIWKPPRGNWINGYWWSPGQSSTHFCITWSKDLQVKDAGANPNDGRSVRCVLSTELENDNDIQGCTGPDAELQPRGHGRRVLHLRPRCRNVLQCADLERTGTWNNRFACQPSRQTWT